MRSEVKQTKKHEKIKTHNYTLFELSYDDQTRQKKNICAIYNVDVANENRKKGQKIKHVNVKRNQIPLRNLKKQHHHQNKTTSIYEKKRRKKN